MKRWLTALALAVIDTVAAQPARSQDAAPLPAKIRVDVQMVSVPLAEAGRVVPAFQDRKTANDAWGRLQAMITNGEATLIAWPVVWVQNGDRGVFESIEEDRYPAEPTPQAPLNPVPAPPTPRVIAPTWGPYTPSAFGTRNAGCTFETDATTKQDGKVIELNLIAQHVRRIATREWHNQANRAGVSGVRQQPEFLNSRVSIVINVRRDEPTLIGTFVVAEPKPHVELFILHAKVTMLPAVTFPPPPLQ